MPYHTVIIKALRYLGKKYGAVCISITPALPEKQGQRLVLIYVIKPLLKPT